MLGSAEEDDAFGGALVAAPFAGGDVDDLAIGVAGDEETKDGWMPGSVQVLYGSAQGLTAEGNQLWNEKTPGLRTPRWGTYGFGKSLAAGFFAGRRYADLAIGAPQTQVAHPDEPADPDDPGATPGGAVNVLYGSPHGLTVNGNQLWRANTYGIKGKAGQDWFGAALAAGNFGKDRDGRPADDLIIGVPWNKDSRGAVHVIYGSRRGLTSRGDQVWRQSTPGIPGDAEDEDSFGTDVAVADFGNNPSGHRYADVAITSPDERVGDVWGAGTVHILSGSAEGLGSQHVQLWREDWLGGQLNKRGGYGFGSVLAPG